MTSYDSISRLALTPRPIPPSRPVSMTCLLTTRPSHHPLQLGQIPSLHAPLPPHIAHAFHRFTFHLKNASYEPSGPHPPPPPSIPTTTPSDPPPVVNPTSCLPTLPVPPSDTPPSKVEVLFPLPAEDPLASVRRSLALQSAIEGSHAIPSSPLSDRSFSNGAGNTHTW